MTVADNVRAQHDLVTQVFGVERLAAVYGFSTGGMQAYRWAALYPDQVTCAIVVFGSARTSPHNKVFLSGLLQTIETAPEHVGGGRFSAEPVAALKAFGRNYAGWGLSQDCYRLQMFRELPDTPDFDTYLRREWSEPFMGRRAANLYAQALAWDYADISDNTRYSGNLHAALQAIQARIMLLPSETDLCFRVADNEAELTQLATATLRPIPSIRGHQVGNPRNHAEDAGFLAVNLRAWLEQ